MADPANKVFIGAFCVALLEHLPEAEKDRITQPIQIIIDAKSCQR